MKKPIAAVALALSALTTGVIHGETPIVFDPVPSRTANRLPKKINREAYRLKSIQAQKSAAAASGEIRAYANMWYKADWDYETPSYGVYSFPVNPGTYFSFPSVVKNQRICGNAGAVYADGKYFVATSEEVNAPNGGYVVMSMKFYLFNTETWAYTEIADADEEFKAMDMAYDPTSDKVYGCFVKRGTNGYYYFGTLDVNTGAVTLIKNYGQQTQYSFTGVAIADNGTIYAINSTGTLCTINKATGETTTIGETGLTDQYMTSAAYEPVSGKIYYALNTDYRQGMYEIDPATAAATKLYDFYDEESVAGMYFPDTPTPAGAPGAASALSASFTDGSLAGTVTFTAPSVTHGGSPLTGQLTYTLKINGTRTSSGTVEPGHTTTVPVTVASPGSYSISVTTANSAGESTPSRTGLFIGPDTPLPLNGATLTDADGRFTLTWDAAESANGGWLNPEALGYRIIRYPEAITVAENHKTTTFSEPRPVPATRTRYYYTVEPVLGTFSPGATTSNTIITGNYSAPCTIDFDHRNDTDDFTLIDGNNDGKTWVWADGQMHSSICLDGPVNDYLVLPPVYLRSGNSYRITFEAKATRSPLQIYPERVALYAGASPQLTALTNRIIPPTDIVTDEYQPVSGDYSPAADGPVYFAIQACSDADKYYLWIDKFSISAPVASQVPAPVSGLEATAGADGALEATISFTLPATDMTGATLNAISGVEIYRGDTLLETISGTPGETKSYTDRNAPNGLQTYSVAVTTAGGRSLKESVEIYVGVHRPVPVTEVTATAGAHNGIITLYWEAPHTDTEGITLPEGSIRYTVTRYDHNTTVIASDITTPHFSDEAARPDAGQEFVQYAVTATNIAGDSDAAYSNTTTYGRPTPTPAHESFADGYATLEFVIERDNDNASWTVTNPPSNPGTEAQDGDGGMLRFTGITAGDAATFISGSFTTASLATPALTFHYLYPSGTDQGITATVNWEENGTLHSASTPALPHKGIVGWQRMIIPLPQADKVQFALTGTNHSEYATTIFIDNISIVDLPTPNVTIHTLSAPAIVEAGEPFPLTAIIENSGATRAETTVELMLNNETIDVFTLILSPGEYAEAQFTHTLGAVHPAQTIYQARATTSGDKIADDNLSAPHRAGVHHNNLPAPADATAVTTPQGASITWTAPDLGPDIPAEITDNVEGYVPFSIGLPGTEIAEDYLGQWTSADIDRLYTIGVGHGSTAIPNASVPKAFMAFNGAAGNLTGSAWECHSGATMFVAFAAIADPGEHNDDWLISPRLTGKPQTISFFARSATDLYGLEQMEVLYSTSGTSPADFTLIEAHSAVPATWTRYSYALPEGTLYFAIRYKSANLFALCVDDLTFTPCGFRGEGLETTGYNLYRDGELLTTLSAGQTQYTDPAVTAENKPTYHVTALYGRRESRPSNGATLDASAIDTPTAASVRIRTSSGHIIIEGAEGMPVIVSTPDGRTTYAGTPDHSLTIAAAPGTYIIRAGATAAKVAVR